MRPMDAGSVDTDANLSQDLEWMDEISLFKHAVSI